MASLARQAVHLAPHTASAHAVLGYVHQKHGLLWATTAVNEYEKAIELSGDDETALEAAAHFQIGKMMYEQMGYWREAHYRWMMALEMEPDFEPARQALNELEPRQGRSTRTAGRRRRK